MTLTRKIDLAMIIFLALIAELLFFGLLAATAAETEKAGAPSAAAIQALGLPQGRLNLLGLSPVVVDGKSVGAVAVYDDPSTPRSVDYLELYDGDGRLVAVGWFDRFGIQRIAVDRALLDGKEKLKGDFVIVVDGEPI